MESLRRNLSWYLLVSLLIVTCFIWSVVLTDNRGDILKIAFLDIGQGDAIYIEAPNGNQMLIDGGPPKKILSSLRKVMPFYDRSIDVILVSNPDTDHIGGFIDVVKNFKVEFMVEPGTKSVTATSAELDRVVIEKKIQKYVAERGQVIWLDKTHNIGFQTLFPDRDISGVLINDGSIVGRLIYNNISIMFTGDSTDKIEHYLASIDGKKLKSDVLKVGHHGSKTSTSEEFVGFVAPKYAVISSGKSNTYGHPHKETLDTLSKFDVDIFRTDKRGTIIMKTDGETLTIK